MRFLKSCHKKQESLNRKDAKLKTRSRGIVQNRDTVLDKAAFSFAATRQMKKLPVFLSVLCALSEAGGSNIFCLGCGHSPP
jgi:peroxiredoxin